MAKKKTSFSIDQATEEKIRVLADKLGVSLSDVITSAIESGLPHVVGAHHKRMMKQIEDMGRFLQEIGYTEEPDKELPHEPGKIIGLDAVSGAEPALGQIYPKATKRKSSN